MPGFIINLGIFLLFLATLTSYAVVLPLPNDDVCQNDSCEGTYVGPINLTFQHYITQHTHGSKFKDVVFTGSDSDQAFLRFAAVVLLGFCGVRAALETFQLINRRLQYLTEPENYIEILLIGCTTTFALAGHIESCFCLSSLTWQIGALALFLGWIDLVLFLKKLPLTGIPINMLQNVVQSFLKLVYLPVILIISFALPFYMLFARVSVVAYC